MKINGQRLKDVRTQELRSIAEVAVVADLTAQRIQQIEKGRYTRLNMNIAKAIAKFLNCKLGDLT